MKRRGENFDLLAGCYQVLERFAFGGRLEEARFCFLEALSGCRRVLVLGEGDGRFLDRLTRRFPEMEVECIDGSAAMLNKARSRLGGGRCGRVVFRQADARACVWEPERYDAVITLFFLDCFFDAEVADLVGRVPGRCGGR